MLNHIKVVEMATYIAAPAAGAILHEWGAEVVKIEPLSGCPMRQFFANASRDDFPDNPVFDLDNRGKRSLALNAATPEAQKIIYALADTADVFITNLRPSALKKQKLDYAILSQRNPKLVYASVTGFGLTGAEKDKPGFDTVAFWARSGMAWIMANKGAPPNRLRTAVGDHVTATACAAGILAALLDAQRTGQGRLVESSLIRAGMYAVGSDLGTFLRYGRIATSRPREQQQIPIMNFFRSKDEKWFYLNARPTETDWPDILRAIGMEELEQDARFATSRDRRSNGEELIALLDTGFAKYDMTALAKRLDANNLIWSEVKDFAAVANDAQAEAAGAFVETPTANGDTYRGLATPLRFHTPDGGMHNPAPTAHAPGIGEHSNAILEELGYTPETIKQLQTQKIVGAPRRAS